MKYFKQIIKNIILSFRLKVARIQRKKYEKDIAEREKIFDLYREYDSIICYEDELKEKGVKSKEFTTAEERLSYTLAIYRLMSETLERQGFRYKRKVKKERRKMLKRFEEFKNRKNKNN